MGVKVFEEFIKKTRSDFRQILRRLEEGDTYSRTKEWLIEQIKKCSSSFEEESLIENLAEEYKEYLKDMKKAMGE